LIIQASREVFPLIDEVRTTLPRIHLLYGNDLATGKAAISVVGNMATATSALNEELEVNLRRANSGKPLKLIKRLPVKLVGRSCGPR
jgi:hypothetical protein